MEAWITLLAVVNVVAFGAMGYDKGRAKRGWDRVPEAQLFTLAALGGAPGIWCGRSVFRHKTIKAGFRAKLVAATAVNGAWLGLWWWSAGSWG